MVLGPVPPRTLIRSDVERATVVVTVFPVAPAIVGAGFTTTDIARVVIAPTESVAVTVIGYVPSGRLLLTVSSPTLELGLVITKAEE